MHPVAYQARQQAGFFSAHVPATLAIPRAVPCLKGPYTRGERMPTQQEIIVHAADLLVEANNCFIEYYQTVVHEFRKEALHPAEEMAINLLTARIHLGRICEDHGIDIQPLLWHFKLCRTTMVGGAK
jgi:hypothetical protein